MKNFITNICSVVILTLAIFNSISGQSKIRIIKSDNEQLVQVLNSVEILAETKTNDIFVRLYEIKNEPGSAGFPNGEVTTNLLIAISEFDEYPLQSLFEIGPFYNPKFNGLPDNRENITLSVSIKELQIRE